MTGPHGVLYGTTVFGGRHGNGTVFSLTPKGSGYTERVLVSFGGAAGSRPDGIVADAHGDLFGTTTIGGAAGAGSSSNWSRGGRGDTPSGCCTALAPALSTTACSRPAPRCSMPRLM